MIGDDLQFILTSVPMVPFQDRESLQCRISLGQGEMVIAIDQGISRREVESCTRRADQLIEYLEPLDRIEGYRIGEGGGVVLQGRGVLRGQRIGPALSATAES